MTNNQIADYLEIALASKKRQLNNLRLPDTLMIHLRNEYLELGTYIEKLRATPDKK